MPDAGQSWMGETAEPASARRTTVAGPIDEHRASDDHVTRHKAPISAVLAVVAAVAHHKKAVRRHDHRFVLYTEFVSAPREMLAGFYAFDRVLRIINVVFLIRLTFLDLASLKRRLIVRGVADDPVFRQQLAVDIDLVVLKLDGFTRQADNAFYVIDLIRNDRRISAAVHFGVNFVARIFENDDVAALDLALRQKRQFTTAGRKDELIHQQIIAHQYRILHRAGRNRNRLQNESHSEYRHHERDNKRFEILAHRRFWRAHWLNFRVCLNLRLWLRHTRKLSQWARKNRRCASISNLL